MNWSKYEQIPFSDLNPIIYIYIYIHSIHHILLGDITSSPWSHHFSTGLGAQEVAPILSCGLEEPGFSQKKVGTKCGFHVSLTFYIDSIHKQKTPVWCWANHHPHFMDMDKRRWSMVVRTVWAKNKDTEPHDYDGLHVDFHLQKRFNWQKKKTAGETSGFNRWTIQNLWTSWGYHGDITNDMGNPLKHIYGGYLHYISINICYVHMHMLSHICTSMIWEFHGIPG